MGWFSLIIFVTLYGLTIKPKIKTFLLATFLYVILFNYPTLYLKSEFKGVNIIEKIQVYKNGFEDFKKEYKLPIPFDLGKKSLLAIAGNDVILGVNNHSNNVFLGECNLKNLNTKSFQENFKYCKFYDSDQQYLSEEGMDFLGIEKKNGFYQINYKILENDIPIIKYEILKFLLFYVRSYIYYNRIYE